MIWLIKKCYYRIAQKLLKFFMRFMDWSDPVLLVGENAVLKLPKLIKERKINKVLIVTDKGLMNLHLLDTLFNKLQEEKVEYAIYDDVKPNPTINNIEECKSLYLKEKCEALIAFGGGSPMDTAKAAGARISNPKKEIKDMRGYLKIRHKLPPLFAIPTTAGTGSEVTLAAVVSNPETHEKYAICDGKLRPIVAVLDPVLTVGLPPHITSTTGMDALTHAVEAYIGKSNVKATINDSKEALILIHDNLVNAYNNGKDLKRREALLKASFLAGKAFTRAFVGYVHAIAHNLGGMYNIPHGLANAVILPYVLKWYGKSVHKKLAKLADLINITNDKMSDEEKANSFIHEIIKMNELMNIPSKFDCIKNEDIPTLVKRILKEGNPGYPVPKIMNEKECEGILRELKA